jgi:hypothetical protein
MSRWDAAVESVSPPHNHLPTTPLLMLITLHHSAAGVPTSGRLPGTAYARGR